MSTYFLSNFNPQQLTSGKALTYRGYHLSFRTDDHFEECYEEAVKIANMNQMKVTGSAFRSRTQKVSSRLEDYLTVETIGKGRSVANDADKNKDENYIFCHPRKYFK